MAELFSRDFHVHTNLSDCGAPEATPEAMLRAGRDAGLEAMGFSDHVIYPKDRPRPGLLREQVPAEYEGMQVFVGCEADVLSRTEFSIDRAFADTLDFVILSASHLNVPGAGHPRGLDVRDEATYIIELMHVAVDSGLADVVAHPFCVPAPTYSFEELVTVADPDALRRLGEKAARSGVAIEFNPRELGRAPDAARWLYRLLMETGVQFAVNSDAHRPSSVAFRGPQHASEEAMRATGLTADMLWRVGERLGAGRQP